MTKTVIILLLLLYCSNIYSQGAWEKPLTNKSDFNHLSEKIAIKTSTVNLTSSNLPIVIINTHGNEIVDDPKITATMGIINNGYNKTNYVSDNFTDYNGKISIEIRGQSSQDLFPKKSYGFETQTETGENNNVALLGMPDENDWILYAPYSDKSLMRNIVSFEIGKILGQYCSRTAFCELVIDNEYQGIYILMEKIKKDNQRVNIATLNEDEISGDDLTGGYIFKVDKTWDVDPIKERWRSENDVDYQYVYPNAKDIANQQKNYLQNYVADAENSLIKGNFANPETGYNKYLNVGSFVDCFIVNEISKEVDKYRYSTYFHKKKESKGNEIWAGPIWDFNLGYGNVDYWFWPEYGWEIDGWVYEEPRRLFWWKHLMYDSYFNDLVKTRWVDLRTNELSDDNIQLMIDSISNYVNEAQKRNYQEWPIIGEYVWPNHNWDNSSYNEEVDFFENWLLKRLDWIDKNLPGATLLPTATAATLSENGDRIKIKLYDDNFNNTLLKNKYFSIKNEPPGISIDTVIYVNSKEATLIIKTKNDPTVAIPDVHFKIDNKILNGFSDIKTNKLTILSAEEKKSANDIKIFAANGFLNLTCTHPNSLPGKLAIYNTLGQISGIYNLENQYKNKIPLNLKPGTYIVYLQLNKKVISDKIIIMN